VPSYRDLDGTVDGRLEFSGFDAEEREFLKKHDIEELSERFMEQARYNDADHSLEAHIGVLMLNVREDGMWTGYCEMIQAVCEFAEEQDDLEDRDWELIDVIVEYLEDRRCERMPDRCNCEDDRAADDEECMNGDTRG
jgi:hypothetical protein